MQLSPNFNLAEFASKDRTPTPHKYLSNLITLAETLEVIRKYHRNQPIKILSGYRSPEHNRRVGGAVNSFHMIGMAADIRILGYNPKQVAENIRSLQDKGIIPMGGVGSYNTFVHVDTRGYKARW